MQISDEDRKKAYEMAVTWSQSTEDDSIISVDDINRLADSVAADLSAARAEGRRECALTHGVSKEQAARQAGEQNQERKS